jgi:integrase
VRVRPPSDSWVNWRWQCTLRAAGISPFRVAETLRHTMASTLLSRGATADAIMAQGGWSNPGVVMSVYAGAIREGNATRARHRAATKATERALRARLAAIEAALAEHAKLSPGTAAPSPSRSPLE